MPNDKSSCRNSAIFADNKTPINRHDKYMKQQIKQKQKGESKIISEND